MQHAILGRTRHQNGLYRVPMREGRTEVALATVAQLFEI